MIKWMQSNVKNIILLILCAVLASSILNNAFLLKRSNSLTSQLSDADERIASLVSDVEYLDRTRPAPGSSVYGLQFSYQSLYPDFYVDPPHEVHEDKYAAYLTFDDGPSARTPDVLKILAAKNIKATFFIAGNLDEYGKKMAKRIVNEGHSVGMHSLTHDYNKIYVSVDAFLKDMYANFQQIYEATGVKPAIFRFPAGSLNPYNRAIFVQIVAEMTRRGFIYYDWNVSSTDAAKGIDSAGILNAVQQGIKGFNRIIVLMHDSGAHSATVAALPGIIESIQKAGFHFAPIDNTVKPVIFAFPQES